MRRFLLILTALAILNGIANAQRLIPKQSGLELFGGLPIQKQGMFSDGSFIAGIGYARYIRGYHYYYVSADYSQQYYRYGSLKIPVRDYLAEGAFMFHLLSTPRKNFLVYAGVYATLGYENVNNGKRILPDGARLNARDCFVYGGGLQLSLEGFVSDYLVLFARARGHFLGGTDMDLFRPGLNFGIRVIM